MDPDARKMVITANTKGQQADVPPLVAQGLPIITSLVRQHPIAGPCTYTSIAAVGDTAVLLLLGWVV